MGSANSKDVCSFALLAPQNNSPLVDNETTQQKEVGGPCNHSLVITDSESGDDSVSCAAAAAADADEDAVPSGQEQLDAATTTSSVKTTDTPMARNTQQASFYASPSKVVVAVVSDLKDENNTSSVVQANDLDTTIDTINSVASERLFI